LNQSAPSNLLSAEEQRTSKVEAIEITTTQAGELEGKVFVVTGGSRGIGRAIVLRAAAQGARVVFCARTLDPEAQAVQEEAERLVGRGRVLAVRADVSLEDDVEALFDVTLGAFGGVDVVINNAGIARDFLLVSLPIEAWDEMMATNLTGAFLISRRAIREFLALGREGKIISIGSVMQHGAPSTAGYAASKGGLAGLTWAIAREYGNRGIDAYLLVVGSVETGMIQDLPQAMKLAVLQACPQKRSASTVEIASVVQFLASQRAGLLNGQMIHVAGGMWEVSV
jgi:3-oxoacyl-[acyl-carrier protein] reductase